MAQNRYVSTYFWKDNYVVDLDPIEKLLFIYLLTNPNTNIAGAYEINVRQIAFDTGIDKDMVLKIINRFEHDNKLTYCKGYIIIRNWIKHQQLNPNVIKGIDRALNLLPEYFDSYMLTDDEGNRLGIDYESLYRAYTEASEYLTKPNYKLKPELELKLNPNAATADDGVLEPTKKATTKELDGMFSYWQSEVGYEITSKYKTNREYAGKLLHEYTKEEIALMIKAAGLASEDRYAPGVSDFIDLYRKWDKLKLWGKKKGMRSASAQF